MNRRAAPFAWTAWAMSVALVVGELGLALATGQPVGELVMTAVLTPTFATLGAVVAAKRSDNAVGWLLLALAVVFAVAGFASGYAKFGLVEEPGALPGAVWMAWVWNSAWWLTLALPATFPLLLLPDGRLPSPRWRPVAWASAAVVTVPALLFALAPGSYEDQGLPAQVTNPLGVTALGPLIEPGVGVASALLGVVATACAASLIMRFVRSRGDERQQLKWVAYATVVIIVWIAAGWMVQFPAFVDDLLQLAAMVLWMAALGVAILRHRLYDIDRMISRTVSYALLTGLLVAVYMAAVFVLQQLLRPITGQSQLSVAGATLAVAALFQPARRRVQVVVDRRFNRARYDAQRTVDEFRARLRDEVDLEQLGTELVAAVQKTVEPAEVSVWLRPREVATKS